MSRDIELIGVPLDLGAGRRGVDMGPSALRIAGIGAALEGLGHRVLDAGNIDVPQGEVEPLGEVQVRYLEPIAQVCERLFDRVRAAVEAQRIPLVLGGDHSLAIGSVSAVARAAREQGGRAGVVWLDAHGDMNTPGSTPSGNVHGMPLACLLGQGHPRLTGLGGGPWLDPADVALIGVRAIDPEEAERIRATGVLVWTMRDVDVRGMAAVMHEAVDALAARCDRLHVSFDVDFVDPSIAPGVGTRVRGGPTYRETHLAMEVLSDSALVGSADVVELNPILDRENTTGELAAEFVASLFGRRIL